MVSDTLRALGPTERGARLDWSLTIPPISAVPALVASGDGNGVLLFDGPAGKLTATHDGARNF
ncbi:hypothetical protein [Cryobacterium sp. Y50]|uniref:hypothetical protein n=1 Tax=Cryobacterium sp. Y50 TaxID=2048286 RepID=UPI000CE3B526|nr:hypothetical protein [Cryobacterium sp. Y50]